MAALKSSSHNFNICLILVLMSVEYLLLVNGADYSQRSWGQEPSVLDQRTSRAVPFPLDAWFPGRWSWEDKSFLRLGCR